jgi:8-oxo-dGTP pyrophosphatase MutT (NUDIX family)
MVTSFPCMYSNPKLYASKAGSYYHLRIGNLSVTLGFVLPVVAEVFRNQSGWALDDNAHPRTLTLTEGDDEPSRSLAVARSVSAVREAGHFKVLKKWRDELKPVYGQNNELLFSVERSACPLLGVVTYGIQMTAFMPGKDDELRVWVQRRAKTKSTYPGILDNTAAGGIQTGEQPFECMVREAEEEASLSSEIVRPRVKSVGSVSYFHIRDERAGGETGLLQPEIQYVYDCELPKGVVPRPCDDEVEAFELLSVDQVKDSLQRREFKPDYTPVILDFLIRHGIINDRNEPEYLDLVQRLHRRLEFPTKQAWK